MNPQSRALLVLASAFSISASASVDSWEWLEIPSPYLSDSVQRQIVSPSEDFLEQWTVEARDLSGRPLQARLAVHNGASSYTADFSYTWTFDVHLPTVRGTLHCPSRLIAAYRDSAGPVRTDTSWFSWNPTDRAMIRRDSWAWWKCPWTDSMALDPEGRLVAKTRCDYSILNGQDTVLTWTRSRRGYANTSSSLPQWFTRTDAIDTTLRSKDSVSIQGFSEHPSHAQLFHWYYGSPTHTMASTGVDSLVWDPSGNLLSTTRWESPGYGNTLTRDQATEYTWSHGHVQTMTQTIWRENSESERRVSTYLYSWDGTAASFRSPHPAALRRTAAGRVSLTLPASGPARVEWVGPDGRRTLLHNGPVPQGSLDLATPRGMGFLRVQQAGQVRVYSLPWW